VDLSPLHKELRRLFATRVVTVGEPRFVELSRAVVRHWPGRLLDEADGDDRAIRHALALCRARVREEWELRHGVGPLWRLLLCGTATGISLALLERWQRSPAWREWIRAASRHLAGWQ
jgi:hypothetical protein